MSRSQSVPMEVNAIQKRRSGLQNDVNLMNYADDHDPWTAWAYKPRTITLLLLGACLLIWASGALGPENTATNDLVTSAKRGIWAMISVFLAYCLLQAPSTVLIRPHPAIWRLVHGMAVVYLVALTFLLFQAEIPDMHFFYRIGSQKAYFKSLFHALILMLFVYQSRDDARQFMKFLHPDLGVGSIFSRPSDDMRSTTA